MQAGWLHNNSVASNTLMRFAKVTCSVHLHWQLNADAAALRRELQVIQVGALFHFFFSLYFGTIWWRHVSYSPGWSGIVCVLHSNYSELILIREGVLFFSGEREEDGERASNTGATYFLSIVCSSSRWGEPRISPSKFSFVPPTTTTTITRRRRVIQTWATLCVGQISIHSNSS